MKTSGKVENVLINLVSIPLISLPFSEMNLIEDLHDIPVVGNLIKMRLCSKRQNSAINYYRAKYLRFIFLFNKDLLFKSKIV